MFYVSWRLWEAHLYVFYVSWRLCEAHLTVFYVSGRLWEAPPLTDLSYRVGPLERTSRVRGEGREGGDHLRSYECLRSAYHARAAIARRIWFLVIFKFGKVNFTFLTFL